MRYQSGVLYNQMFGALWSQKFSVFSSLCGTVLCPVGWRSVYQKSVPRSRQHYLIQALDGSLCVESGAVWKDGCRHNVTVDWILVFINKNMNMSLDWHLSPVKYSYCCFRRKCQEVEFIVSKFLKKWTVSGCSFPYNNARLTLVCCTLDKICKKKLII